MPIDIPSPKAVNGQLDQRIQGKIDQKTKPLGALGHVEALALKVVRLLGDPPGIERPTMVVFAGDHGAADSGISSYPKEVTYQMVLNFLRGGAAINVFAKQVGMELMVVDAGVHGDLEAHPKLCSRKIAEGTANYLEAPAMTAAQLEQAIQSGRQIVSKLADQGVNTVGFGEMGIGNSSSASLLMSVLTQMPLEACVGRGTGLDDAGLNRKWRLLQKAKSRHGEPEDPMMALACYGGFEIAMMAGAYAEAAHRGMLILVDGFIATAALLPIWASEPRVLDWCVFSHCSAEKGHEALLARLGGQPLLRLGMRLGEGTGAALALPLIKAAVNFYNEMASFDQAGVSQRDA